MQPPRLLTAGHQQPWDTCTCRGALSPRGEESVAHSHTQGHKGEEVSVHLL